MKIVVIGATSAIAMETARLYAGEGAAFFLVGRDETKLRAVADDLRVRGASAVETLAADLADLSRHDEIARRAGESIDLVLIAHGTLPDQKTLDGDPQAQVAAFHVNATSVISIGASFASVLERNRRGSLVVIGSVAGDRGRRSNYVYGAAKAAVHVWCDGLRPRMREAGGNVLLVKPGWVDTPMTMGMRKNPLFASARSIGRGIHAAVAARQGTVYLPWYWRWISLAVRMLPERLVRF